MLRRCLLHRWMGSNWPTWYKQSHVTNSLHYKICRLSNIYWSSKLQTKIALSTAETEYIAFLCALWEVIPLMMVMDELNGVFPILMDTPQFFCKVWENSQSCITMATFQKFIPQTKYIALKYHNFKWYVESSQISINYIHTEMQQAIFWQSQYGLTCSRNFIYVDGMASNFNLILLYQSGYFATRERNDIRLDIWQTIYDKPWLGGDLASLLCWNFRPKQREVLESTKTAHFLHSNSKVFSSRLVDAQGTTSTVLNLPTSKLGWTSSVKNVKMSVR